MVLLLLVFLCACLSLLPCITSVAHHLGIYFILKHSSDTLDKLSTKQPACEIFSPAAADLAVPG